MRAPVLFLIFNRPETTKKVFERIKIAKPAKLYIAADGPRRNKDSEIEKVKKTRDIVSSIDWDCKVSTLFRENNLGCRKAISSAITWFFSQEEKGIILEDDCLPEHSFFYFCEELLTRYENDERVWAITGDNFMKGQIIGNASYFFSKYSHCWGWATWKRSWDKYEEDISIWESYFSSSEWKKLTPLEAERKYWLRIFQRVKNQKVDSWAYLWMWTTWKNNGLIATPNFNLVSNIGFGPDATHTKSNFTKTANIKAVPLQKLIHPIHFTQDVKADRFVFMHALGGKYEFFPLLHIRLIYRFLKSLLRRFNIEQ